MGFSFLPVEYNFYDLFERQSGYAVDAAACFKELVSKGTLDDSLLQKMRDIEHLGDGVTHEILNSLNKTFITPFDRETYTLLLKSWMTSST